MRINSWWNKASREILMKVLVITMLCSLLTACRTLFGEKNAPARSFTPEELLIGIEIFPTGWYTFPPIHPVGDALVTQESVCQGFGKTVNDEQVGSVAQCIYRQQNAEVAARVFEHVYLPRKRHKTPLDEWGFQSLTAQQTSFGCSEAPDGSGYLVCEWGSQYEEYIVTFSVQLVPDEVSLADMGSLVEAIDNRMSEYLALPVDDTE